MLFFLFWSMRTSKIGDEHIAFNDGENMLCFLECVLLLASLSVSERKFSLVNIGPPCSLYTCSA